MRQRDDGRPTYASVSRSWRKCLTGCSIRNEARESHCSQLSTVSKNRMSDHRDIVTLTKLNIDALTEFAANQKQLMMSFPFRVCKLTEPTFWWILKLLASAASRKSESIIYVMRIQWKVLLDLPCFLDQENISNSLHKSIWTTWILLFELANVSFKSVERLVRNRQ